MFVQKVFILLVFLSLISCKTEIKEEQNPVKVIFDTDMGSDCDDVGALALLHVYADLGKAEILGCIYSSGKIPFGAGVIDAINTWYRRPKIPIGATYKNEIGDPVDKMNAEILAKDTVAFGHNIIYNKDAAEQTKSNRAILVQQPDKSVVYITVGHTKGLYDLLVSESDDISPLTGKELINQKVKKWVALGALNANNKEGNYTKDWNFFFNGTAPYTEYLVKNFPNDIVFIGTGSEIMTGKSLKSTPSGNIVRKAYESWLWNYSNKTLDDQRPSWDIIAVYYTIEDLGEFLKKEESGWLDFDEKTGCRWNIGDNDFKHSYIILKEGVKTEFENYLNNMIARQPAY